MSERIRIDKVTQEADTWSNRFGEYQGYDLDLVKENGEVEIGVGNNRKLKPDGSHFEPKAGEEVWGSIEQDGRGGQKLAIDANRMKDEPLDGHQTSSPASSQPRSTSKGSGGGETDWTVKGAEIRRQHSQEMALRWYAMGDELPGGVEQIASVTDWFDQDAIAAGQKASRYEDPGAFAHPPEQPIDFTGAPKHESHTERIMRKFRASELQGQADLAAPSEFPDDERERQDMMELLDAKGITNPEAASQITEFYMSMDAKRQLKCGNALMAEEFTKALDSLVAQTEAWMNKKLPALVSVTEQELDEELPFNHPEYKVMGDHERLRWRF